MKIGSHSQTLVSLTSLLDASKQQQDELEKLQDKKLEETRDSRLTARKSERDDLIQKNRDALKLIQDDIRLKNLNKLQQNEELEGDWSSDGNLNYRESFPPQGAAPDQPAFKKLGQIIDIKI